MKNGLRPGSSAEVVVIVDQAMSAVFGGKLVHELYSTSSLVQHMEWSARKLIEPYLESSEDAMGFSVEVSHLAMTVPGMEVHIKATLTEIRDRKIVCDVEAYNVRGKIARGTFTQALVDKTWLDKKRKELTIISHLSAQAEPAQKSK